MLLILLQTVERNGEVLRVELFRAVAVPRLVHTYGPTVYQVRSSLKLNFSFLDTTDFNL